MNGGQLVVRTLMELGQRQIFGLHGAHIDPVFQAALDLGLEIVDCRSEATVGHAAEGYARASRGLGVALVTAGGGFTNVMTPLANAFCDRTPLLVIAGSGMLREAETNTLQAGIDQVAVARPVTKWAHRVTLGEQIPRLVAQAVRIALSAPRGPVLLDIPWDILAGPVPDDTTGIAAAWEFSGAAPSRAFIAQALDILDAAEQPIVVVGSEATRGRADEPLARLAELSGLPVFSDYEGFAALSCLEEGVGGLIQSLHYCGKQGVRPDAILLLGVRFGLNTLHGSGLLFPHDARIIQIDPDARELGRLQQVAAAAEADVATTIAAMAEAAACRAWRDRTQWRGKVETLVARKLDELQPDPCEAGTIHPLAAIKTVASHLTRDHLLVADGALSYLWLSEIVSVARPGAFLCHGYLGSMGVGLGTAIGAQVQAAQQGKRAILVTGDGAIGYALADFDTLVRHDIPLIVIVMNNQSWGATQHFQKIIVGDNRVTGTMLQNGSYHQVAEGFGVKGYFVDTAADFAAALADALATKAPACINVRVALEPIPPEEMLLLGIEESGGGIGA